MKKIITILFSMLFVTSAYSLEFDSATDSCLREILDKRESEITVEDLQKIDKFYCYSDITTESFNELVENFKDNTKIFISENKNHVEGIVFEGNFITGFFLDNGNFITGLWDKDEFVPGYYDLEHGKFIHGLSVDDSFVPGIIKGGIFIPGIISKKIFIKGIYILDDKGFLKFKNGDFIDNFKDISSVFTGGISGFNISTDDLFKIGGKNIFIGYGQETRGIGWDQGIFEKGMDRTSLYAGVGTALGMFVGTVTTGLGGPTAAGFVGGIIYAGGFVGSAVSAVVIGTNNEWREEQNKKEEEKEAKKEEANKDETEEGKKEETEKEDDEKDKKNTGCESPDSEKNTGSNNGNSDDSGTFKHEEGNIDYGYEGEGKTTGNGTGTGMEIEKGDIDYGEDGNPNDNNSGIDLGNEETIPVIIFDPGDVDPFNPIEKIEKPVLVK